MIAIPRDRASVSPNPFNLLHIGLRAIQVAEYEIDVGYLPIGNEKKSLVIRMLARISHLEIVIEGWLRLSGQQMLQGDRRSEVVEHKLIDLAGGNLHGLLPLRPPPRERAESERTTERPK